jgi:2-polyprenyl-6-methoxyphenol hydroxylase-like FAD-dependent oxidoreductase
MHDVIVSGGGPAGSYLAFECARKGLDVLLLEKDSLGRKKCCAGGLLQRSLRVMDGISIPESLVERELTGFSFVVQGERFPYRLQHPLGIMVRREAFDLHLARSAEKAGALVGDGVKVLSVKEAVDRILVRTSNGEMEAKYLAIAEGASSRLTSSLMGEHPANWSAMGSALEVMTKARPNPSMEIHLLSVGRRVLRSSPSFPLTGAVFPLRESVMVSTVGKSCSAAEMRTGLQNMMVQVVRRRGQSVLPSFADRPAETNEVRKGDRRWGRRWVGKPLLRRRALLRAHERVLWFSGFSSSMPEWQGSGPKALRGRGPSKDRSKAHRSQPGRSLAALGGQSVRPRKADEELWQAGRTGGCLCDVLKR